MFATNPIELKNIMNTSDEDNCPICNTLLQKTEIIVRKRNECYECMQDDRPFNYMRKHKECVCQWYDSTELLITCQTCVEHETVQKREREKVNMIENEKMEKEERMKERMLFLEKWNNGVNGKLSCYGLKKLQKLAKQKQMKGYSKFSKTQLILQLESIVNESDFPIHD